MSLQRAIATLALFVLSFAAPAAADPTGTSYGAFLDAPVNDSLGNAATETHNAFGAAFDGSPDAFDLDLILFNGPPPMSDTFVTPNGAWLDESSTSSGGGIEEVVIWIFGDDDGDATPPSSGSFGSLFENTIDTGDVNAVVNFGLEQLHWAGITSASGQFAVLLNYSFVLSFSGGTTNSPVTPLGSFSFGDGTVESPLFVAFSFDPSDFTGDPTDFHAHLTFLHVPEPASAVLAGAGLLALVSIVRRRAIRRVS